MAKMRKQQDSPCPMEKAMGLINLSDRRTDPLGSYTGQPLDRGERPVQDADDL